MITHLFLDAGNTIVFVNMGIVSERLARRGVDLSPGRLWEAEHRVRARIDTPEVVGASDDGSRWTLYFSGILRDCGVDREDLVGPLLDELRAIHSRSNLWEIVPPEVPATLEALRKRHRLAVVSNANGTVREKLRRVGLADYFDLILDSHEEGVEKPDPRIFRIALERTGARPEETVHVGDFYHIDVLGARAAGIEAVLLDPGAVHRDKPVERLSDLAALPAWIDGRSRRPL
jgi:putative hydrolase of the HAD superfamily